MCKKFLGLFLTGFLTLCSCQGAPPPGWSFSPQRSTPGNHVGAGRFYLDLNENTKVTATGIESGRDGLFSTKFNAASLTIEQDRASWEGAIAALDRKITMQDRYFDGVETITFGVMERIPAIIKEFVPTLDLLIKTRGDVAMTNALQPTVVEQILGAIAAKHFDFDLVSASLKDILPGVVNDVAARLPNK